MGHQIHLTLREREDIMLMRRDGRGVSEIARAIGRSKSTASRELKRNSCERFFRASTAQRRHEGRRLACRRRRALDDERVFNLVRDKFLEEQRSPEQIEGRLALELGETPSATPPSIAASTPAASTAASAGARPSSGSGTAAPTRTPTAFCASTFRKANRWRA